MVDTLYIEEAVRDHPRTLAICDRFPTATQVNIDHYGSVFNPRAQNFRLQKQNPSMILARKGGELVQDAPEEYSTGGDRHYYFSHMLNCVYDCRYCFLQGMFRSAHYLLFVNYEDFVTEIKRVAGRHSAGETWFFSGYDCDSLALEPMTGFAQHFVPVFRELPGAMLELRTKSTQVRKLLAQEPVDNVIVAFSLSPNDVASALETGAPDLSRRLEAARKLQHAGWQVGIRLDPLIWHQEFEASYARMFSEIFRELDASSLHSVTLGPFRLPNEYYRNMFRLYPDHKLFGSGLARNGGMVSYDDATQAQMLEYCAGLLDSYVSPEIVYQYAVSTSG